MTENRSLDTSRLALEQNQNQPTLHLTEQVRKPNSLPGGDDVASNAFPASAHPSIPLIAQLNHNWRVVDDPLQWILQRRKGKTRNKSSGWQGRSFCRTRESLLRCIREYCGEVDPNELAKLGALPDYQSDTTGRQREGSGGNGGTR